MSSITRKIVVVDDEIKLLNALKRALELENFKVSVFTNPLEAIDFILNDVPDLVISDIKMKEMSGIELLEKVHKLNSSIPFILITAYSSIETAIMAIRLGANDYLLKPFEIDEFLLSVKRVLSSKNSSAKDSSKLEEIDENKNQIKVIGCSKAIKEILQKVSAISEVDSSVLIVGETGTGKELIAKLIHYNSKRRNSNFITVNCSAIPETQFELELFGECKLDFASSAKGLIPNKGLIFQADGGTLFFDEIVDVSLNNQVKLARFLEEKESKKQISELNDYIYNKLDIRIIAATNKNLTYEVSSGNFREDLYYRLSTIVIYLPPLRDRFEDLPDLVSFLLEKYSKKHKRGRFVIQPSFLEALKNYSWPGNIRELESFIERLVIIKREGTLTSEDVVNNLNNSEYNIIGLSNTSLLTPPKLDLSFEKSISLDSIMEKIESEIIHKALIKTNWNYSRAASILGITRQNLHYKLKKYNFIKD